MLIAVFLNTIFVTSKVDNTKHKNENITDITHVNNLSIILK